MKYIFHFFPAQELANIALKRADMLAQKYGKLNYHIGGKFDVRFNYAYFQRFNNHMKYNVSIKTHHLNLVSRAFRLAITLGVGLAVVSTIALIVVLVRHQKTIRKATREMQFQRLAANQFSGQYSDEPRGVEMDFVKGVKYDKLPIVS